MDRLRFVLIEPDQLVRTAIALVLNHAGHEVVAEFEGPRQALPYIDKKNGVDMLIGEISMQEDHDFVKAALAAQPKLKLLILSAQSSLHQVRMAIALGANAYILKECYREELQLAIRRVADGRRYLHSSIAEAILEIKKFWQDEVEISIDASYFTDRELEVLELIGQGMTNEQMSESLFLSKRTIEGHRQSLLTKTRCKNSAELIRFTMRQGLLQ